MDGPEDDRDSYREVARRAQQLLKAGGPTDGLPPAEFLERIVAVINSTPEPDEELVGWVGCGDLENLVRDHGVELWEQIERLARSDARFRRALRSVWAYDSPEYERRSALLGELGEFRTTWIRFVVEPTDLSDKPGLSWRAIELEGSVSKQQLAPLLRSIAEWFERDTE
ncbi:MAG TPA: hypothetical protein VM121_04985 [Acidimicrobiales bacterium]|nr:hypothetical protein [Acidimicrobiales bacterium]